MTVGPERKRPVVFATGILPQKRTFTCDWCGKEKTSRQKCIGILDDGTNLDICNGCHGQLNTGQPKVKLKVEL